MSNWYLTKKKSYYDPRRYKRLVGKLHYLIETHPNITFTLNVVSKFLNSPCQDNWDAITQILIIGQITKIREILKLLGVLKLTRQTHQVTDTRLHGIMFLLKVFQYNRKVRKKCYYKVKCKSGI